MQGNEWVLTDKGYFVYGNNALKGNEAYRYTASVGERFFVADKPLMEYLPERGLSDINASVVRQEYSGRFSFRRIAGYIDEEKLCGL